MNNRLSITILGSGTCVPDLEKSACAVLMETDDSRLLFDIGPGTMRRLLQTGLCIQDIDYVLISHFHPDHTGELAAFLFANKYPDLSRRQRRLTLAGGPGFRAFFEKLAAAYPEWITWPELAVTELTPETPNKRDFGDFTLSWTPAAHQPESIAYRVAAGAEACAVYTGDSDFSREIIDLARGADLLICESALPDQMKVDGHMTPHLSGKTATEASVGALVLTHFYPECDNVDIRAQTRKTYSGPLHLARDLMKIHLPEGSVTWPK